MGVGAPSVGRCGRRGPAHCLKLAAPGRPDRSPPRRGEHERGPGSVGPSQRPTPNASRAPRTHGEARAARDSPTQEDSLESAVEPAGQETIKGTAAGEGLHTGERCFAVDPHGLQVHGSHQAPTCWVRSGGLMGRPRTQSSKGPAGPGLGAGPRPLAEFRGRFRRGASEQEGVVAPTSRPRRLKI